MRPKEIFAKYINTDKPSIDIEKLKVTNPSLWKKLKKKFDIGRKIVTVQISNCLDRTNENVLREYLMEYANRFLKYGPQSFPTSFNTLEPFFKYNHPNSIIQLHEEEESYGVSLIDFLDFVTDSSFTLNNIDFYENIPENVIYNISFTTGFDEVNFSNNGKSFIISGLSLIRNNNEVSILMQAGESFEKYEAENYFADILNNETINSLNPIKEALGMKPTNRNEAKVVFFEGRDNLWLHNVGVLFDLNEKEIDIRFIARDENTGYRILTDDYYAMFNGQNHLTEEECKNFYKDNLENLSSYDAVFDFAKYCLALPYYIFENEDRIIDITYETKLRNVLKGPITKREFREVPITYKLFAKPIYYIESQNQTVIKDGELDDKSFKVEKSGFWKRLNINEGGFDKKGNKIIGKTWVERNDIYYIVPKEVTKIERVEVYEGENAGYIYIMRQPIHEENIFKIGLTKRSTKERSKELSNTSSPDKFFVIVSYNTRDCIKAEKEIHQELENYRLTERREFFRCDLKIIMEVCQKIVSKVNEHDVS